MNILNFQYKINNSANIYRQHLFFPIYSTFTTSTLDLINLANSPIVSFVNVKPYIKHTKI